MDRNAQKTHLSHRDFLNSGKLRWMLMSLLILSVSGNIFAQTDFYSIDQVQEIRIYFDEPNWDEVLDSLYVEGLRNRMACDVEINGTRFENVGIRYKGFSSVSVDRVKNPFNIDLDYFQDYQSYHGVDKIKLSNVIQDPSFIREVLSYEIAREYMPASRANYANVYINDTLWGLYTNVESVDDRFLQTHFGSDHFTFFKCNPLDLDLNGENSNLSDSPGTDPDNYHELYTIKSETGWEDLYRLIDTLNHYPEQVGGVLNVDRTLWMHAFNYALVNFDSYIGYAQNFYLYKDEYGIFQPVIWDLNMSFGSFRFTDASEYFSGFNVQEAKTMDPLAHYNTFSVHPRPLLRNLFEQDTWRRMYLAHLRTIVEEQFLSGDYYMRAQYLQNLIDSDVAADTNRFYPYADFHTNLDTTVADLIEYPGIYDLIEARAAYLAGYPGFQGAPSLQNRTQIAAEVSIGEGVTLQLEVDAADSVILAYRFEEGAPFWQVPMFDDGNHGDGGAADGIFGVELPEIGPAIEYYFYAENDSAGAFLPARAAFEFFRFQPHINAGQLVINELGTAGGLAVVDPTGENDPWIELYNPGNFDIPLETMYLSNRSDDQFLWAFPDTLLPAGAYLTLWADADTQQTGLHTNFQLLSEGGDLTLSYADGILLDEISYGPQNAFTTLGRYPNGTGPFIEMLPSEGRPNNFVQGGILTEDLFLFPNPAGEEVNLKINQAPPWDLRVMSADGRIVMDQMNVSENSLVTLDLSRFAPGLYLFHISGNDFTATQKLIITE